MTLSETWFTDGYIDFELQQYRLLAYLKEVHEYFSEHKLYPQLADVVHHYNNLLAFRHNRQLMQDQFPRQLDSINTHKLELVYEQMEDTGAMKELEQITSYALETMKATLHEGTTLYDFVEKRMSIEPVGIMPLYRNEGYILIGCANQREVRVYNFTVTLFEHQQARYRGIRMDYMDSREKGPGNTYEQIKIDIIRAIRTLPNPAVYRVDFPLAVPYDETLLPVAKRMLARQIETI